MKNTKQSLAKLEFGKKIGFIVIAILILIGGCVFSTAKVLAATGGGTATIGVDGGAQGGAVTVVQSTSHIFTTVLTINISGMTLGAASPTFTIPTGFTAPNTNAVATAGGVDVDGEWSVAASGGGCAVDSSPVSSTTVASGQVITVDITADCAVGNTITLTYQGTSSIAMGATALTVSTADAGDPGPVTPLIAGSPTITVTAASTPTPTPTPTTSSAVSLALSDGGGSNSIFCPALGIQIVSPVVLESKRVSPTSIFISWGPYSGVNTFSIQYSPTNGNWLYSTDVVGFSTTINDLPENVPMWVRVGARSDCTIGIYGQSKLVGGPGLPSAGFAPNVLVLNMTSSDFFFISAGLSIWIVIIIWVFIFYKLTHFITEAEIEVKSIKDSLKLGGLKLLSKILELSKGGEKNDSK